MPKYRGRRLPFLGFALPDPISAIPRVSGPILMFCAPRLIFGGTEGVRSRFLVLRSQIDFQRYRGHRFSFSCFALADLFSELSRTSGLVLIFCVPTLIFGGTERVGSRFHVLRSGLMFGGTMGVGFRFHVFRSRTHFRRNRGRRIMLSYFAPSGSLSAVPRASGPIVMFCAHELVIGGNDGVGSHYNILRARTRFRWY
jgi:hypothetical protein